MSGPLVLPNVFGPLAGPDSTLLLDQNYNYLASVYLDSIAALRLTTPKTAGGQAPRVFITGYTAPGDGGGGWYWFNAADTTTVDNGGTVIVAADGGRWYLTTKKQWVLVTQFGADPTGVADSTSAILAASQSFTIVVFPPGTYKVTNLVLPNITNCEWRAFAVGGVGITTTTTGVMITWTGGGFSVISGIIFSPTGTLASSTGMVIQGGCNNLELNHCTFQLWTKIGMQHLGTVGTPLSGHKLYDCYFLQNANASGFGQLDMTYNNDFFFEKCQFGIINTGLYGFPSFGVRADHTSNGSYISNFVWQNLQGAQFTTCAYDRILSNRFEQSQHEGVIANGCTAMMFQNNWINNNGQATINTYIQARFQGIVNTQVHGNNFYDWSLGVNNAKYSMSFESACTRISIKNNVADKYGTAATFFDATMPATTNTTDGSIRCNSGATVAAGLTVYLAQGATAATASAAAQYLDTSHTIVQLIVQISVQPGVGQNFVYTLYKDGVATALTITLSGASAFQAVANATTVIEALANGSSYTVQLVTSAGAAASSHWAQVVFVNR